MTKVLTLSIARTADGNGLQLPKYSSPYHVGLNLQAALPAALRLEPGDRAYVPAGFAIGIPDGYCGFVVSQPLLAKEQGLIVADAPQVIHPADRGALFMLLQNMSSNVVVLHRGDVVAQLVIQPVIQATWHDLSEGIAVSGSTIKEKDVVVDSVGMAEEAESHDKMNSPRRTYRGPRNRFSDEDNKDE